MIGSSPNIGARKVMGCGEVLRMRVPKTGFPAALRVVRPSRRWPGAAVSGAFFAGACVVRGAPSGARLVPAAESWSGAR
jgi:hypothetical protein